VEDETALAALVTARLRASGFLVDHVREVGDAAVCIELTAFDLVILDRRLPDGDGISLVPLIRRLRPGVPAIVLTALDTVAERVSGLDAGADDYLTKPFAMDELVARVRAGLRRRGGGGRDVLVCGRIGYDQAQRQASIGDEPLVLPRQELALLELLLERAGKVVQRAAIEQKLYGLDDDVQPNALDAQVSRLRRRLQGLDAGVVIHTVRGVGYMMKAA
jgi:two-component system OmpR family response regulator